MARAKPKTPAKSGSGKKKDASLAFKSPKTPGWMSAKASMFQSPKLSSPVTRRITRRSSVFVTKTKSPVSKSPTSKELVSGAKILQQTMKFKHPAPKKLVKSGKSSPALTRSRRSSTIQTNRKASVSPGKSPSKSKKVSTRTRQSEKSAQGKKPAAKQPTANQEKAVSKKSTPVKKSPLKRKLPRRDGSLPKSPKVSKEEKSKETKIPKPVHKSPGKKTTAKVEKQSSPKKPLTKKKTTPKRKPLTTSPAKTPKSVEKSPKKKVLRSSSPSKTATPKVVATPVKITSTVEEAATKGKEAQRNASPSKAKPKSSELKKSSPTKRTRSRSASAKKMSSSAQKKPKTTPKKPETPKTPAAKVTRLEASVTPRLQTKKTPARSKSPSKKTPARAKSPKKTPARGKSSAKKTPSRAKSPPKKSPTRGRSPVRKSALSVKSGKTVKKVTLSPAFITPDTTATKTEIKRTLTPFVRSPAKAVKVLGITPKSAKTLVTMKAQRLGGRTPPRTSTLMSDRKRQAVFNPEVSTIRVKRTKQSVDQLDTGKLQKPVQRGAGDLNVNNNADDSVVKPASWYSWCTIL